MEIFITILGAALVCLLAVCGLALCLGMGRADRAADELRRLRKGGKENDSLPTRDPSTHDPSTLL